MAHRPQPSIWWFAFGYFACYAPYSATAKAVSKGLIPGKDAVNGFELLPSTVMASAVGMALFLALTGWWRHAERHAFLGLSIPGPTRFTLLSGLTTAAIIGTTTLAYTFTGVSIVFMMLLMRGGVLVIAPMVDALSGRRPRWFSIVALLLSLAALVVAFSEKGGFDMQVVAAIDVAVYLVSYFIRLRLMSWKAKSDDPNANLKYFAEEQLVAVPALLLVMAGLAVVGQGELMLAFRRGFTTFWTDSGVVPYALLVGFLSQGTGIFGGLILLDKRDNTFCVPVNRSSSILAGLLASLMLTAAFGNPFPSLHQVAGAGLIIAALMFLSIPPILERRSR
jgi:hypothetical protein